MATMKPATMKAVRINEFGGPNVPVMRTCPSRKIGSDEVLVKVKAAGVNPVEYLNRNSKSHPLSNDI